MDTMKTIAEPEKLRLGTSLPPGDPHGVSVHLPKWADTVGWALREPRVVDAMTTGYPRFFLSLVVDRLAVRLLELASPSDVVGVEKTGQRLSRLLDSVRHAQMFRKALPEWDTTQRTSSRDIGVYTVTWDGEITAVKEDNVPNQFECRRIGDEGIVLVSYPAELAAEAKAFWQHTGFGISSRRATHWLEDAPFLSASPAPNPTPRPPAEMISRKINHARAALKQRIAIGHSSPSNNLHVSPSDVFLFPTGMTAITETADTIKSLRHPTPDSPYRVAIFGFPYVDTVKVLHRVLGYVPTLYHSTPTALDTLEETLLTGSIDMLITEFPGNPLLQSPDLTRLHALAQKHHFVLVVDDTVGTHASLALLGACDVVCTSLSKMFSGGCNVMGGTVTLNPASPFYHRLKDVLEGRREKGEGEGAWFWEDVVTMEENSRDFEARVARASANAEVVAGLLRGSGAVGEVYYPKGAPTQELYDRYRVEGGRYGFLVTVRFTAPERAVAFHDAMDVAKGPSFGTNFTLCCAHTLLAHYKELEWAAEYGVVEHLVRISVGLEEREWLEERVTRALRAAEGVSV
ncbi:putative cystathionine gamma-synthase/beta-lyase [Chaetomidium leptoderma]|uniref:Cystathionine gamma-synthase/beta-lyase n=1 Tax=Chaetomidium leptoderma TaxID=669021 RepID=A0AAN6VLI7_9PEZI|nr:putative cystathionine gamma-synthase/beta-lyase [Chaetomidium leptoderma]